MKHNVSWHETHTVNKMSEGLITTLFYGIQHSMSVITEWAM